MGWLAIFKAIPASVYLTAAVIGALLFAAFRIEGLHQELEEKNAQVVEASARADSLKATLKLQRDLARERDAIDAQGTQELKDGKAAEDRFSSDVERGSKRLHIAATCPPVRATTRAAGVDDDRAPELSIAARQDYYALRRQLTEQRTAMISLQDYVRSVCLAPRTAGSQ